MLKDKIFILSFVTLLTLTSIHHVGLVLYWYFTMPWLDILMHFLGGFWVVLFALWIVFQSGYINIISPSRKNIFLVTISTIIFIGVSWEIFELVAGIIIREGYVFDTILDGIMDAVGAAVAFFVFTKWGNKKTLE